jgi:flagellar assembly factor FliW
MNNSTKLGQLDVDATTALKFPCGIPGFETSTEWKLLYEENDDGKPSAGIVFHLQSLAEPDIILSLADPADFGFNFEFVLSDSETAELQLDAPSDLAVLVVLSNKSPSQQDRLTSLQDVFANIAAPILINTKSRIGMQKVFTGPEAKVEFRPPN